MDAPWTTQVLPYWDGIWTAVLGLATLTGGMVGVIAWRAGGRWKETALALAYGGFVVPFLHVGYRLEGAEGLLAAWLGALAIGVPLILIAAGLLVMAGNVRVAAWGQTTILAQCIIVAIAASEWLLLAESLGLLSFAWIADRVLRPDGWWNKRAEPWLERHTGFLIGCGVVILTASPVLLVYALGAGPTAVRHFAEGAANAIPLQHLSPGWLLPAWFMVWGMATAIALSLKARIDRLRVVLACLPFMVWSLMLYALPSAANQYVTFGVVLSALMVIGISAIAVVRHDDGGDESPGQSSWVREGRAMLFVRASDKRRRP